MKRKKLFIVILLFFVIGLSACSNKNASAAQKVDDAINLIAETVTLDTEPAIIAARTAYNALTDAQKALVKKYSNLESAEISLANLVNLNAANPVIALIAALPSIITLENEDQIVAARVAFNALTNAQEGIVGNSSKLKLEAAERDLEFLKLAEENEETENLNAANAVISLIEALPEVISIAEKNSVLAARAAYELLTVTQKAIVGTSLRLKLETAELALVALLDQAAATAVEDLIAALPATVTLEDETAIVGARAAYDALTTVQKDLVALLSVTDLETAELALVALLDQAAATAVEDLIAALPAESALTYLDSDAVIAARAAYNALSETQKSLLIAQSLLDLDNIESAMIDIMNQYAADLLIASDVKDLIAALPTNIELVNETAVNDVKVEYDALTATQKILVENYAILEAALARIVKLKDADYQVIFAAIEQLGSRVTDDVVLPDTVNWALKEEEDATIFDVATGKLLKNVYAVKEIVLIATHKTETSKFEEVTINFGMLAAGEKALLYTDLSTYVSETHWNGWTMTKVYTVGEDVKTDVLFHINEVVVVSGETGSVDANVLTTAASTTWSSAGSAILNAGPESITFALGLACGPNGFRVAVVVKADGTVKEMSVDANKVITLEKDEFVWLARFLDENPAFNLALESNFSTTTEMRLEKIQAPNVTVSFNVDGTITKVVTKEGSQVAAPETPIKLGFTFDGWFTTSTFTGTAVVFPYTVTSGVTLYAKFTENIVD